MLRERFRRGGCERGFFGRRRRERLGDDRERLDRDRRLLENLGGLRRGRRGGGNPLEADFHAVARGAGERRKRLAEADRDAGHRLAQLEHFVGRNRSDEVREVGGKDQTRLLHRLEQVDHVDVRLGVVSGVRRTTAGLDHQLGLRLVFRAQRGQRHDRARGSFSARGHRRLARRPGDTRGATDEGEG